MKKFTYLFAFFFVFNITFAQTQLDTAVNFSVKDIYGNTLQLFPLLDDGKIVVIDFFTTTCAPCALYAPEIQASYEDFGENNGNVFFMGIAWGDDNAGVAYFDSLYGVTFPTVSGSQGGGNIVHNAYQIMSAPTVILIAPDREILEQYIWEPTQANLNALIIAAGGSMVGIDDKHALSDNNVFIYPNPARDRVTVRIEVAKTSVYHIEIYNLIGTRVQQSSPGILTEGTHSLNIDLNNLPGGTYFIRLLKDGKHESLNRLIHIGS
ncbi:MAG: T9SS type A sorting domain-containing protein [Bacteroidetes bacterium]|nr:T9SS type A sorting domain-containing protein [Bacteroidota bacterium]